MSRYKSTLDILRTDVKCGMKDNRLLYLLRMKSLRILEKRLSSKLYSKVVVVTARLNNFNYCNNGYLRDDINKNLPNAIRGYKKLVVRLLNIVTNAHYCEEYKDNTFTREEFMEKVKYLERTYKNCKKLIKLETAILENLTQKEILVDKEQIITLDKDIISNCTLDGTAGIVYSNLKIYDGNLDYLTAEVGISGHHIMLYDPSSHECLTSLTRHITNNVIMGVPAIKHNTHMYVGNGISHHIYPEFGTTETDLSKVSNEIQVCVIKDDVVKKVTKPKHLEINKKFNKRRMRGF